MSLSLPENIIIVEVDNRPLYWIRLITVHGSRMLLYIKGKEHGKLLVDSVLNGPFQYGTMVEPGNETTLATTKARVEHTLISHMKKRFEIWDRVKLLIQGSELSLRKRESMLYDDFDTFTSMPEETIHSYYTRFAQLINDMHMIVSFQTDDLDVFESDCDDIPSAKAVLMANLPSYDSDVLSERSQLINFVSKFLGTIRFRNDQIAKIMGYGDYQLGNVTILWVYYVEGLGHSLFSVGQFCDLDPEVAFRKHTCYVWNLEGDDLLSGSRDTNLYTISLDDMRKSSPICLLSKASKTKSWLWHQRLCHLNFGTLNQLAKKGLV
nr:integrase, catalytic region, zinc finger, CCHC-type, peptidase aspartic, catalytic [Tanacetum cinerariifolium]